MRLHRFFLPTETEKLAGQSTVQLSAVELIHQWRNVFRLKVGDKVILLDNSSAEFECEIISLSKTEAELKVLASAPAKNLPKKEVWLFAALIKKDNFEWILEKCTELGVAHFVPVVSERSEKKNLNLERARKIVKEASEQSGRGTLPEVHEILSLEDAVKLAEENKIEMVALHPVISGGALEGVARSSKQNLAVFIGPEGGWTEKELALFASQKISLHSLGPQILRAETAAVAVCALLLL